MTVDTREWTRAAKELQETSSRTCVDFINGQSLKVASLALKMTHKANDQQIERQLGAIGQKIQFHKLTQGKRKGKTVVRKGDYIFHKDNDTLAHRILYVRKKLTGDFGVKGETMDQKAQTLIRNRIKGSSFIKSGWIPVIAYFSSIVRQKPAKATTSKGGAKVYGRPKGKGYRANFSLFGKIESAIENTALNAKVIPPSKAGNPYKFGVDGLRKALAESARDMIETLQRRLQPDFKKVSAK